MNSLSKQTARCTPNVQAWLPQTTTIRAGDNEARATSGAELIGRVRITKPPTINELSTPANPLEPYTRNFDACWSANDN